LVNILPPGGSSQEAPTSSRQDKWWEYVTAMGNICQGAYAAFAVKAINKSYTVFTLEKVNTVNIAKELAAQK
jgi:hypothetical protein